ncbi:HD family protein [Grosmannia clavigera kw1407]|uniref:5'-deoxynucleotidase n=1 Tax=Grosmannia clavigera (strain kw1407 / UAMH 11150) TaxID=655863 RepID=F0XIN3_GROCL|nr:HD family protein [Grosmannia clavigera kw1407]EFX02503.1 HD family protein [Grosmannia clavigera kw1407]
MIYDNDGASPAQDASQEKLIADHMYRMSLITMLAPPSLSSRLDMTRCMKMCLIHDMAESLVGDITPVDGVPKPEKSRRESSTMDYITETLLGNVGGGNPGREMRHIWQEYEDSRTPESIFVHDVDKIELLLQMAEYEKRGDGRIDLSEFAYVATKLSLPETNEWAEQILRERDEFWGSRLHVQNDQGVDGGVSTDRNEMRNAYYTQNGEARSDND